MGVYLVDILSQSDRFDITVTSRSERHSSQPNVAYVRGNARDMDFVTPLLQNHYDVIIDFMNYDLDEFRDRCPVLLQFCAQYVWFSSSRVYADSAVPLTESSPRLLEVSADKDFLATNRYALRKARQEDLLTGSGFDNYTIIRPYITYSSERLQLGIYEKEQWLYRMLNGRDLVINKDIIDKQTTLTYGHDVSLAVARLLGNTKALGQIVQIASRESMTWREILRLYLSVIKASTGLSPRIFLCDRMKAIDELYEGGYNTIYDRVYDRHFDSTFVETLTKEQGGVSYRDMKSGLRACLSDFLDSKRTFLKIDWQFEAYQDMLTGQTASPDEFAGDTDRAAYSRFRNTPISQLFEKDYQLEEISF